MVFQLHLASHKNSQFRCGICYMRITKGRESMDHENLHSNRSDLQCIFCDQPFEKRADLVCHMETHVSNKFSNKNLIHTYLFNSSVRYLLLQLQNGDVHTICYICGIRIRTQTMDGRHIKGHLGIKDFECSYCSRKFVDRQHLQRHLRTHVSCNA